MTPIDPGDNEPVKIPVDGMLDLHAFAPEDAASVVREYLRECLEKKSMRFGSFMAKDGGYYAERYTHSLKSIRTL